MPTVIEAIFFDLGDTLVGGEPMPGAKDALAQLQAKGGRLGIISNTGQLTLDDLKTQIPASPNCPPNGRVRGGRQPSFGNSRPRPSRFMSATSSRRRT
jgi:hypothetical protein